MENPFEIILEKLDRIEDKLNRQERDKIEVDELMDIDDLGKYIGYQRTSIYGLVQKNKIPYIKRGKLFFRKSDIDIWLNRGKKSTNKDIKKQTEQYFLNTSGKTLK